LVSRCFGMEWVFQGWFDIFSHCCLEGLLFWVCTPKATSLLNRRLSMLFRLGEIIRPKRHLLIARRRSRILTGLWFDVVMFGYHFGFALLWHGVGVPRLVRYYIQQCTNPKEKTLEAAMTENIEPTLEHPLHAKATRRSEVALGF
jgi:hypothetical protein